MIIHYSYFIFYYIDTSYTNRRIVPKNAIPKLFSAILQELVSAGNVKAKVPLNVVAWDKLLATMPVLAVDTHFMFLLPDGSTSAYTEKPYRSHQVKQLKKYAALIVGLWLKCFKDGICKMLSDDANRVILSLKNNFSLILNNHIFWHQEAELHASLISDRVIRLDPEQEHLFNTKFLKRWLPTGTPTSQT